ncbi:hypothetical protein [Rhizorhabdus wittichii]|uniref:hypothetical protein n=1 Tax=Rhizorhabdus wittichii TaxID=160791 RepID=UPI0002E13FBD|nr:hypothetical protein [Rhizorhabdus wittichii]
MAKPTTPTPAAAKTVPAAAPPTPAAAGVSAEDFAALKARVAKLERRADGQKMIRGDA